MSKGYRNGAFALGLVTGAGLALNLFLWLDYTTNTPSDYPSQPNHEAHYSEIGNWWDRLIGTFVSPTSESLTQWIMAVFTIFAVFLVWKTLIATQDMARDTQRIGEAQARAYLSFFELEMVFERPEANAPCQSVRLRPRIKNTGCSPAIIRFLTSVAHISPENKGKIEEIEIDAARRIASTMKVGAGNAIFLGGQSLSWQDIAEARRKGKPIIVAGRVEFDDVFSTRFTEDFAVYAGFTDDFSDPSLPLEQQPRVEWYDAGINIRIIHKDQQGSDQNCS